MTLAKDYRDFDQRMYNDMLNLMISKKISRVEAAEQVADAYGENTDWMKVEGAIQPLTYSDGVTVTEADLVARWASCEEV